MKKLSKRVTSGLLILAMVFSMQYAFVENVYAATGYDRGYSGGKYGNSTGKIYAEGLDISAWQGDFNFYNVKNAGYDYVILRCGTTSGKDSYFETNYQKAKNAGLDVGVYYYSYATTVSGAVQDANSCLSWISGKKFEYPIYFDYEDSSQDGLSQTTALNINLTFLDMVAEKGYLAGMYTGEYKSTTLPMSQICAKYEFWVASYYNDGLHTSRDVRYAAMAGMWQYTSTKYVNGVGPLDANVCYKDYPAIVKTYGFNGYSAGVEEELPVAQPGCYDACSSSYTSLYPALESIGIYCDWELHKMIAAANGIYGFEGTVAQNTYLLDLLKQGKLKKPTSSTTIPEVEYFPVCEGSYTSLYPALESIGVYCDWELHRKIAIANGIFDFEGTVEQNTQLLNLLKQGKLIKPEEELKVILSSDKTNIAVGETVTLSAEATGGKGTYTYSFLINNVSTNEWYRYGKGTFKSDNNHKWTATGAGDRKFFVEAKDETGTVVRSEAKLIKVSNVETTPLAITTSVDNANPTVGTSVKITGNATGGDGKYTYSFLINNPATNEWYRYGSGTFKTGNTHTWKAAGSGKRNFYVEVKDGTGKVVRSKAAVINIAKEETELAITGKASTNTVAVGETVTITGTATGGDGKYTYSFLINNPATNEWYRYGNGTFKTGKTHTWKAAGTGKRNFYVEVKDGTGKVIRSKAVCISIK